jgi:hypothetical protein
VRPDEIPAELVTILDTVAGRQHSEDGTVLTALAQILTRHRQLVLADAVLNGFGVDPVPAGPGFRVSAMYAFLALDADDDEGVPAILVGTTMMPLVAADADRLKSLRPVARNLARSGTPIRLARFTRREDIELLEP